MEMLEEPSQPPQPPQPPQPKPKAGTAERVNNQSALDLLQGRSSLSAYIHTADSRYQKAAPREDEEDFVNTFVRGLRDKRNRKKCERKFADSERTWGNVKECFPVASQHSQSHGGMRKDVAKRKRRRESVDETENRERTDVTTTPLPGSPSPQTPPTKKRPNLEKKGKGELSVPPVTPNAARKRNHQVERDNREPEGARLPRTPSPAKKKSLLGEARAQLDIRNMATPQHEKKRGTKKIGKRQERAPSIPILPSSDDEFS
jgi:hypothetical protein